MANITKAELVDQVAASAGTDKTTAAAVLKAFEEVVTAGVKNGTAFFMGPDRIMQNMGPLGGFTPQVQAAGF